MKGISQYVWLILVEYALELKAFIDKKNKHEAIFESVVTHLAHFFWFLGPTRKSKQMIQVRVEGSKVGTRLSQQHL